MIHHCLRARREVQKGGERGAIGGAARVDGLDERPRPRRALPLHGVDGLTDAE